MASSIKGATQLGRLVHPDEMRPIDLIVCGSVAVNRKGARLGKGGGYSDLEYAVALSLGLISKETPNCDDGPPYPAWCRTNCR